MATNEPLNRSLDQMGELETFLHAFLTKLDARQLKPGEDVTRYVKQFRLKLPSVFKGATITWEGQGEQHTHGGRPQRWY
jgi:hypothetical protein